MILRSELRTSVQMLLRRGIPHDQAWAEAEILLAAAMKHPREWLLAHPEAPVPAAPLRRFHGLLARRLKHEPIAYLLGQAEFLGRLFAVDARVLIPRPETEEIVRAAIQLAPTLPHPLAVVDIGTGSGAIAISFKAALLDHAVFATDISTDALSVARKNARRILGGTHGIQFQKSSLLDTSLERRLLAPAFRAHLFVANLPYLPASDRKVLTPDVVRFEPGQALFARDEGLALNTKLLAQLATFQARSSRPLALLMEFDPPQAKTLLYTAARSFPNADITVERDACGRDRYLSLKQKGRPE